MSSQSSGVVPVDGKKVRYYRDHGGYGGSMTQYTLAKRTHLSRSFIADIEQGRRQPRRLAAQAIAEALGVTIDDLLVDDQ